MSDTHAYLLTEVTDVERDRDALVLGVRAVRAAPLPDGSGWVTGEPLEQQGVELSMPNLPALAQPPLEERRYVLRVSAATPRTVRLLLAPAGARALAEPATWLGVVTDPAPGPVAPSVDDRADAVVFTVAGARVVVRRRPFGITVEPGADRSPGRPVLRTAERMRQVAGLPTAPPVLADGQGTTLNLELDGDDNVSGFGEQFGRLVKNGQRLVLRVSDALGTGTGRAYKPAPVWHTGRGATAFLNTGATVTADVGHSRPDVLALTVADEAVDLYVSVSDDPKARLSDLCALTGRAPVPPVWAFGFWMGRCRYHSRTEMEDVADGMAAHDVPCDVLHLDPDWLVVDRLNTDFIWNTGRFGDRADFVRSLAERGCRLSVWELPYLDPASPRYAEAERQGYLVRTADGNTASVAGTPVPDGRPRALVDFGNSDARAWWQDMHRPFFEDGVAVFKTDFGEGLPDDAVLADGTPPNHAHNLYPLTYNAAVSEATARYTGRPPLVWGRSGWTGSQRYPCQWGGDAESTVPGMRATLRGGLSHALSMPGFWSHDVGGFFGPELNSELYVRWTQFGALSPLMRAHGLRPREPWSFGARALEIARDWIRLRYSLLPYLWQVAVESAANGWPMLRPVVLEYPDDPVAPHLDGQFLLGRDLLVVPVFDDSPAPVSRRFYAPEGSWTDLLTGERFAGPGFHRVDVPLERMPLLARAGAALPRVDVADARRTDDLLERPWTIHLAGDETDREWDLTGFDMSPTRVRIAGGHITADGTQVVSSAAVRMSPIASPFIDERR